LNARKLFFFFFLILYIFFNCFRAGSNNDLLHVFDQLKTQSLASIDFQIRALNGAKLGQFVSMLIAVLEIRKDFDLIQSYMAAFLNIHRENLWKGRKGEGGRRKKQDEEEENLSVDEKLGKDEEQNVLLKVFLIKLLFGRAPWYQTSEISKSFKNCQNTKLWRNKNIYNSRDLADIKIKFPIQEMGNSRGSTRSLIQMIYSRDVISSASTDFCLFFALRFYLLTLFIFRFLSPAF